MQSFPTSGSTIRPVQHRDLEIIQQLQLEQIANDQLEAWALEYVQYTRKIGAWFTLIKLVSWFPNPWRHLFKAYVAETNGQVQGYIRVLPVNSSRSTWRLDQVAVTTGQNHNIGTQLIRYCLESCWEARTWLLEVGVNHKDAIALYRQNGFQPLAQLTGWEISSEVLTELAQHRPDLPNLLPVNNADAALLYQLDTSAMPPQIRQVYDLGINDFRSNLLDKLVDHAQNTLNYTQEVSGYVYEPQRKAAIGYFSLLLQQPHAKRELPLKHQCQLTVHPAYTWLYPELMAQIAQIIGKQVGANNSVLLISSADYQPEREAYLEQIQAGRRRHALLMARSVWHKVREFKPALEALHLSGVLSGFQPTGKPVPGRIDAIPSPHADDLP